MSNSKRLFTLLCTVYLLASLHRVSCTSPVKQPGVVTSWDYGILHLGPLTGLIPKSDGTQQDPATAFTHLKAVKNVTTGELKLRGHVWLFNPADLSVRGSIWHYSPNEKFYDGSFRTPTFQLRKAARGVPVNASVEDGTALTFTIIQENYIMHFHDGVRPSPYIIELSVPNNWSNEGMFCIDDWFSTAYFGDLHSVAKPDESYGPLSIWMVSKPGFRTNPRYLTHVIDLFTQHHSYLGMNGTLQYERGPYLNHIMEHPGLQQHIRAGRLQIMWWDHAASQLPHPGENSHLDRHVHDQYLVNNHAALAFMSRNTYLYFADYDDILIVPQPHPSGAPLIDMIRNKDGCLHGNKLIGIPRVQYQCAEVNDPGKQNLWGPHDNKPEPIIHMPPRFRCNTIDLFNAKAGEPLRQGDNYIDKILAFADTLRYIGIHNALMMTAEAEKEGRANTKKYVKIPCVYVAHLSNWVDLVGAVKDDELNVTQYMTLEDRGKGGDPQSTPHSTAQQTRKRTRYNFDPDEIQR